MERALAIVLPISQILKQTDLAAPPGYSTDKLALDVTAKDQDGKLVVKKAWDVALAPLKQVGHLV